MKFCHNLVRVLLLCILLVAVVLLGGFLINKYALKRPQISTIKERTSTTKPKSIQDVRLQSDVIKKLDATTDPCENFYEFACGQQARNLLVTAERTGSGTINNFQDLVSKQLEGFIKDPIDPNEVNVFQQVKTFYQACMDTSKIEELGEKPFLDVLAKIGQFPALTEDWDEGNFSWIETTFKFKEHGLNMYYLIQPTLFYNPKNSSKQQLNVSICIANYLIQL